MIGCIVWGKATNNGGYGIQWRHGKCHLAHRLAYSDSHGPIPQKMLVLHKCDNPPCVNPEHLFLGTQLENMIDMRSKGRSPFQRGHIPRAIISKEIAHIIRKEYKRGGVSMSQLATKHGLKSKGSISDIVAGRKWA